VAKKLQRRQNNNVKNSLVHVLKDFLKRHFRPGSPLLLGYSGGPDSEALLRLLLECRTHFPFELHLAHVDHGWRPEAQDEAQALRQKAEGLGLPFFLQTLTWDKKNNWEEEGRNARIQFFYALHEKYQYQALLLAHQADDHAESVLKRIFEGAHVSKLCALYAVAEWEKMSVWRPLIGVRKQELVQYLKERDIAFHIDPLNDSPRFLRGRMRSSLLPQLTQTFGKEIVGNLCFLGRESAKIKEYFERKVAHYLENQRSFAFGHFLDLPAGLEEIEVQFLLKQWFTQVDCTLSRQTLETLAARRGGVFPLKGRWIYLRGSRLFILDRPPVELKDVLNKL
jgi:tRNA(Ile)-lysidine synthase